MREHYETALRLEREEKERLINEETQATKVCVTDDYAAPYDAGHCDASPRFFRLPLDFRYNDSIVHAYRSRWRL